ncbi:metallophosphoesterase family protein, partial [uncultured Ruminococcus sp.]|uniref:purple acid phosphatase family protein n=1 Tax=uncultured Ruminococcus sp. TaxID=165186 RepID=UPI0025CD2A85
MKKYSKFLAGVLAVLLSAGSTGLYAVANKDENKADTKADSSSSKADDSSEKDGYKSPEIHKREKKSGNSSESEKGDVTRKEETVYVLTDANGKPAAGVAVYSGDTKLGVTGKDGICNTDEFIGSVQEIYVYANGKDGYSFTKKAQSLKALGDESGAPYHIIANATLDASTTKNIVWMSNPIASAEKAVMQYAKKSDYDAQGEAAFTAFEGKTTLSEFTASGNINENGAVFVKEVLLTGLVPETEYCYRVGDGEIFSDVKNFTTYKQYDRKGGNSLKFFVIGDAQTDDENVNNLVQIIEDTKTGYDFGTQIGDAVEVPKLYSDWNNFLTQFSAYDVDFLHAIGNHETFSDPGATNANTIFGTPNDHYYSTVDGNVYIATVAFTQDRAELQEAAKWLAEDAAKATTPWKVLIMHQPPYYTNSDGGNEIIQELFAPAVDAGGIDFVFSGHDHSYARTYPLIGGKVAEDYQMADKGEEEVTTYSGDGAIYYIAGSTGQKAYPIDTQVPHFGLFSKATIDFDSIYLSIEANDESFTVKTMDGETKIDSFTKLSKSNTCAHVYDYYDASDASLHCEKCDRLFDAKSIAHTGAVKDFETGKLRFLSGGEPQTGIQTIDEKAVVFGNDALAYDGTLDIAGTTYTFENGALTDCSDKEAGEVFFGYCGAEAGGKNLIYAYQPGNEVVNIGVNPMMENATGAMKNWENFRDVPWQTHRLTITKYNIGEGVTT